jgi:hypothetical protein
MIDAVLRHTPERNASFIAPENPDKQYQERISVSSVITPAVGFRMRESF